LKHITVSEANYLTLKTLGNAGDSFNDVVTGVLKKVGSVLQFDSEVGAYHQAATTTIASKRSITKGVQSNYA
jgi:predicted CopG family antitoxin